MFLVPLALLVVLLVVVFAANVMKKKGAMTESAYQTLISVMSIIVTVAALVMLYWRLRA